MPRVLGLGEESFDDLYSRFSLSIASWMTWGTELMVDVPFLCELHEEVTAELWAIVSTDDLRESMFSKDFLEGCDCLVMWAFSGQSASWSNSPQVSGTHYCRMS